MRVQAAKFLKLNQYAEALGEAQIAVLLAPESTDAQSAPGDALSGLGRMPEAKAAYEAALQDALTVDPEFQKGAVEGLRKKVDGVR